MKHIEFTATFGNERKMVKISQHLGAGNGYFIYINNFYQGALSKYQDTWVLHSNRRELNGDDIAVLGEIVEGEIT